MLQFHAKQKITFIFLSLFLCKCLCVCVMAKTESVHLLSHRRPSPGLTPLDGLPPAADLLVHMAGHTAEKRQVVQQSGGVYYDGDADGSRAHELQADSAAPPGPESKGMRKLLCYQLVFELLSQHH